MKTIIVIPTYNEKDNVRELVERIFAQSVSGLEILFVDDNSPDGTAGIIKELQKNYPIHLLERTGKLGLGSAYIAGFKKALALGADLVFEMDADFSHNPTDIPRLIAACESGADLAIGSRKVSGGGVVGWGWKRKFMSNGAMWFARILLRLKAKDVTAGFRCFQRRVLETIDLEKIKSNGYAFQEELLYYTERAGFKVADVPVVFVDRLKGQSKLGKKDITEFFKTVLRLCFKK